MKDHVVANIHIERDTEVIVRARYVVGADGASSLVRRLIGQKFEGKTYVEDWLIVDAFKRERSIDHVEFICDHRRPVSHMPAPAGRERWEFKLRPEETLEEVEADGRIQAMLSPWGAPSLHEDRTQSGLPISMRVSQMPLAKGAFSLLVTPRTSRHRLLAKGWLRGCATH